MNKNILYKALLFAVIISLTSCGGGTKKPDDAVARVNDQYLTSSDLKGIVPKGTSKKDSAAIIQNYIQSWIHQQLVLQQADENLSSEQKNFEKQIEDYRNSLITYSYEKELIRQKLDTVVTDAQVNDYYQKHPNDFTLKENIVKVLYVKLPIKSATIPRMKQLIQSEKPNDRKTMEDLCKQYATNYYLDDNSWLYFNDLLKEIPLKAYDQERFLASNKLVELNDTASSYILFFKDFKVKENSSPVNFEASNIRNIILNQRKLKLITQMEKDVYEKAVKEKSFEIFK
ncbi:MAG: hypothetical protein V2A54_05915 [Bacteroidota bacterium]